MADLKIRIVRILKPRHRFKLRQTNVYTRHGAYPLPAPLPPCTLKSTRSKEMKPIPLLTAAMVLAIAAPLVNANPYADNTSGSIVRNNYGECWQTANYQAADQTIECGAPDADGDGVSDLKDQCPGTAKGEEVGATGCPVEVDGDGDGVLDANDACPNTPRGQKVDARGCSIPTKAKAKPVVHNDGDNDGVYDADDACPNTPAGHSVTPAGCSTIRVSVHFDTDKADLSDADIAELKAAAAALGDKGIIEVVASGYADRRGPAAYNNQLSMKRAQAAKALLTRLGVADAKITAQAGGELNSGDLANDRRVDIVGKPFGH